MSRTLLVAERIERHRGEHTILAGVSLSVVTGSRIGLIGPNGSGKSTLLRILAGAEQPDHGTVRAFAPLCRLDAVGAETATNANLTIAATANATTDTATNATINASVTTASQWLETVTGVAAAADELDRRTTRLTRDPTATAIEEHAETLERWLALGGDEAKSKLATAARDHGLTGDLINRPVGELSGGQMSRLGLAAIAAATGSLLLLDEPSNHLDAGGLRELTSLLRAHATGFILVSHDRQLLADTCNEIVAIDRTDGSATHFDCDFDTYERERAATAELAAKEYRQALGRREDRLRAEAELRARAARTARSARVPRDNDKNIPKAAIASSQGVQSRARKMTARLRSEPLPDKPWVTPAASLTLTAAERRGAWIVELHDAVWERGNWHLGPIDLAVKAGSRLALLGPNGSGKSTILDTLAGRLRPTAGEFVVAQGAVVVELGQRHSALSGDSSLTAAVRELTGAGESDARTALARFGLTAEQVRRPAATLSPGERTRAELAMLGLRRADCLLLDEPTNHLDIEALEVLQDALRDWPGALVIASHDRRLLDALAIDSEIQVQGRRD